jgi:hypothetical protein
VAVPIDVKHRQSPQALLVLSDISQMAEQEDPTSPLSPLAPYPPLPSPEYRNRAPEFYGFVAWTSTAFLYFVYLLWALLPDAYIEWLGIEWYPSRQVLFTPKPDGQ